MVPESYFIVDFYLNKSILLLGYCKAEKSFKKHNRRDKSGKVVHD